MRRTVLAGLLANALLMSAGCSGGDKPPPGANDADTILAATSNIVFQCRAVERGFMSIDEEALERDVDALVEAAEEFDPEATFRRPQSFEPDLPVDSETSLRDQAELAIARLEDQSCSPRDAERLRDAIGD